MESLFLKYLSSNSIELEQTIYVPITRLFEIYWWKLHTFYVTEFSVSNRIALLGPKLLSGNFSKIFRTPLDCCFYFYLLQLDITQSWYFHRKSADISESSVNRSFSSCHFSLYYVVHYNACNVFTVPILQVKITFKAL